MLGVVMDTLASGPGTRTPEPILGIAEVGGSVAESGVQVHRGAYQNHAHALGIDNTLQRDGSGPTRR